MISKKLFPFSVVFSLILLLTFANEISAKAVKPVLIKVQSAFGTNLPGLGTTLAWMKERTEITSSGKMRLKIYEPNKLVAPFEILDAVSTGKIHAGFSVAGYWSGKIPSAPIFSTVPFGPEVGEYLAWFYHGNGGNLYQEMYDQAGYNVKVLVCGILAAETSGWFSKPIQSPKDLKGLKIRFYGLGGKVLQKLGASISLIPAGEIFPALEKGVIDATEFSMPAIDERLGFYKVVKYNYYPGWHQQATVLELLINKDKWNSLHESQKILLDTVSRAATLEAFAYTEAIQFEAMNKNIKQRGVKNMRWSKEMLDVFEKTWNEVVKEESQKNPFFKKAWNDLKNFRNNYYIWKSNAFMPRIREEDETINIQQD